MVATRNLDGLGRRVIRIVESDDIITAISSSAIGSTVPKQKSSIHRAAREVGVECLIIESVMLRSLGQLDVISSPSGVRLNTENPQTQADPLVFYRSVCEAVARMKSLIVVIYAAEKMDRQALSMLGRVSRFAIRNQLVFRAILIGDVPRLGKNAFHSGLRIDGFVPRKMAAIAKDLQTGQEAHSRQHHTSLSVT